MSRQTTRQPAVDPLIAVAAYAPAELSPDAFAAVHDRVRRDGATAAIEPASARAVPAGRAMRNPRARRRVVLVGAVAAGAVALTVGLGVSWLSPNDAYASWTPTPTTPPGAALARAESVCYADAGPRTTILAEQRGVFTFTLRTDDHRVRDCLIDESGSGSGGDTALAGLRAPAEGGITVVADMTVSVVHSGSATALYGRAGDAVTAVTITRSNGFTVKATVSGGWWAAWWPGDTDPEATLTVHRSDGTTSSPLSLDDPTISDYP